MSIQNRLLFVYTTIYVVAFILFATIVYLLPRNRIVSEIDSDLSALATEVLSEQPVHTTEDGTVAFQLPPEFNNLETASTFFVFVDQDREIVLRSNNIRGFQDLFDPDGFSDEAVFAQEVRNGTALRVLTVPLRDESDSEGEPLGYIQIARLVDSVEIFNRSLVIALFFGFAAAIGSLFLAVLLTPGSFKPLEDIANVARQITNADDLSRRVPDTGRTDEIGVLTRSINQTLERLERLFQTQQRLLADVSHELRTPLTTIRGNLDLMRRMGNGDLESMDTIQEEVDRMTRLVGDLLLLARADAGGLPLAKSVLELDSLLFEVYRQAEIIGKGRVEVMLTAVDPVRISGDTDRLKQLLLNLVTNAIKYTQPGGTVSLRLSHTDDWAIVEVSDSGIGIPPEDIPFIFDRFYRVDKARSRGLGGTGLGLSIVKWIAQAHGGDVTVTSAVGEGSTFIVSLPAEKAIDPSVEEGSTVNGEPQGRSTFMNLGAPLLRRREEVKESDAPNG